MNARDYRIQITGWPGQLPELTAAIQKEAYEKPMAEVNESRRLGTDLKRGGTRGVGQLWQGVNPDGSVRRVEAVEL